MVHNYIQPQRSHATAGGGRKFFLILAALVFGIGIHLFYNPAGISESRKWVGIRFKKNAHDVVDYENMVIPPFPKELLGTMYSKSDFRNEKGNVPPFWQELSQSDLSNEREITNDSIDDDDLSLNGEGDFIDQSFTSDGAVHNSTKLTSWGPCYPPHPNKTPIDWNQTIKKHGNKVEYSENISKFSRKGFYGFCRPGFIIIGAGKCGTSSLYHYLVGHPRVLPAKMKQIHYFKYQPQATMEWYYSKFPTTQSFLSSGALMTGEASPGYLPYPDVAHRVATRFPGPKIIIIAREPLDRAWSSYNYNYVLPAVKKLMKKGNVGYPRGKSKEYYMKHHLFSFEDLVRAELKVLRECLKPGGVAESRAREKFSFWAKEEYLRREKEGLPPLLDLEYNCYGAEVSREVPRAQWAELVKEKPERIISRLPNYQLIQGMVGRGLYTLVLEWWYVNFPKEDIYLVCSEDLRERPTKTLSDVASFLGLPEFNFTGIVSEGMYNVAGHKGYDKATSWENVEKENKQTNDILLSEEMRDDLVEFYQPYNERLFELTGRRCNW